MDSQDDDEDDCDSDKEAHAYRLLGPRFVAFGREPAAEQAESGVVGVDALDPPDGLFGSGDVVHRFDLCDGDVVRRPGR